MFFTIAGVFLIILGVGFSAPGSWAQDNANDVLRQLESPPEPPSTKEAAPPEEVQKPTPEETKNNYKDIPKEYLEEANAFFKNCGTNPNLSRYYDCKCLTIRYLDQRIERGPDITEMSILQSIQNSCADASEAAGLEYMRCLGNGLMLPDNIPPKTYCKCFANTYAKLHERSNMQNSSRKQLALKKQAMLTCRNPDLARELYPTIIR